MGVPRPESFPTPASVGSQPTWTQPNTPQLGGQYSGRMLITGASGFVGSNLARAFRAHNLVGVVGFSKVPSTDDVDAATTRARADLRDGAEVSRLIHELNPEVVIHVAGNKNVKHCEQDPDAAIAINRTATAHVARACQDISAKLVYLSTDLVFDGEVGGYSETSVPRPGTVYGRTKLAGEDEALTICDRAVVCRTGGVYGLGSPLFAWLEQELSAGKSVEAFQDVVSTPTYVGDLAVFINRVLVNDVSGTLHTVGSEAVSRYEWFSQFATAFGYDRHLIMPAVAGARRRELLLPRDVSLKGHQTEARLGYRAAPPRAGLDLLRRASHTKARTS